jgi:hypothetical protein
MHSDAVPLLSIVIGWGQVLQKNRRRIGALNLPSLPTLNQWQCRFPCLPLPLRDFDTLPIPPSPLFPHL